jgi:CBS domain-containing protein
VEEISVTQAKRYGIWSCTAGTSLLEAANLMVQEDVSCLVVLDDEGYLAGIITRTDILLAQQQENDWQSLDVSKCMSKEVVTVYPQDKLDYVSRLLTENHIHRVVVIEPAPGKPRPLGVLSDADLLYHLVNQVG